MDNEFPTRNQDTLLSSDAAGAEEIGGTSPPLPASPVTESHGDHPSDSSCNGCRRSFGCLCNRPQLCPIEHGGCGRRYCEACIDYACAIEAETRELGINAPLHNFCKECFQIVSLLDFSTHVTILGPEAGAAPSFVFIHGAGGCRNMFEAHARQLSEENGFRCVLIDLPGHGSRMDETLTMDSAIDTILRDTNSHTAAFKGMKPVAVGGSLGGYLLMEFVGKYPDVFDACIVAMCGQNVGVGRGWAASMGLYILEYLMRSISSSTALKLMVDEACKNKYIDKEMLIPILRTGMFFKENPSQINILKATNPAESLPKYDGFILFVNGSEDHRDSENVWLRTAKAARLIDYQGGDHFFTHDRRFMQAFISECAKLASVSS